MARRSERSCVQLLVIPLSCNNSGQVVCTHLSTTKLLNINQNSYKVPKAESISVHVARYSCLHVL